jgi:glycosyltransferase involved in cell wall biosynthesis
MLEMNTPILVSIIVPVYGVESYIERCARSIFEQTYAHLEFLFVDDCSPDRSVEILLRVLEDYPERKNQFRLERFKTNKGVSVVRRYLHDHCKGDFLFAIDSDDWIDKDTIEKLVKKQQEHNSDIVSGDYMIHFQGGKFVDNRNNPQGKEDYLISMLRGQERQYLWGRLVRTSLFRDYNIVAKDGMNIGEDWQMTPLLVYHSKAIDFVSEPLYHYNQENTSSATRIQSFEKFYKIRMGTIQSLCELNSSFSKIAPQYCPHIQHVICWHLYDLHVKCCKNNKRDLFKQVKCNYGHFDYLSYVYSGKVGGMFAFISNHFYLLRFLLFVKGKIK